MYSIISRDFFSPQIVYSIFSCALFLPFLGLSYFIMRNKRDVFVIYLSSAIITLCTSISQIIITYRVNNTTWNMYLFFVVLIYLLWILSLWYGYGFFFSKEQLWYFYFFGSIVVFLGIVFLFAKTFMLKFIIYECITLSTLPLVLFKNNNKNYHSTIKYFLYLVIPSSCLLVVSMYCDAIVNTYYSSFDNTFILHVLLILAFFSIVKTSVYPLHSWLIHASVAPIPVSGLFHAVVVVKIGIIFLMNIYSVIPGISFFYSIIILFLCYAVISLSLKTLSAHNLKIILVYSTIIQLHYLLIFIFAGVDSNTIMKYLFSHSLAKIVLFMSVGGIYLRLNTLDLLHIKHKGKFVSVFLIPYFLASLSLIGIPFFNGFFIKMHVFRQLMSHTMSFLFVITFFVSSLCMLHYYFKILFMAFYPLKDSHNYLQKCLLYKTSIHVKIVPYIPIVILSLFWYEGRDYIGFFV